MSGQHRDSRQHWTIALKLGPSPGLCLSFAEGHSVPWKIRDRYKGYLKATLRPHAQWNAGSGFGANPSFVISNICISLSLKYSFVRFASYWATLQSMTRSWRNWKEGTLWKEGSTLCLRVRWWSRIPCDQGTSYDAARFVVMVTTMNWFSWIWLAAGDSGIVIVFHLIYIKC